MNYYTNILGTLYCNNIIKVIEILKEKDLIDYVEISENEIKFIKSINHFSPSEIEELKYYCNGKLYCSGESFDDKYVVIFKNNSMIIKRPSFGILKEVG